MTLTPISALPQPWLRQGLVTLSAGTPAPDTARYDGSRVITLTLDQLIALITEAITPATNLANELRAKVDALKLGAETPTPETFSATPPGGKPSSPSSPTPLFGLARAIAANRAARAASGQ